MRSFQPNPSGGMMLQIMWMQGAAKWHSELSNIRSHNVINNSEFPKQRSHRALENSEFQNTQLKCHFRDSNTGNLMLEAWILRLGDMKITGASLLGELRV